MPKVEQHKAWFWVILNVVLVLLGLFLIVAGKSILMQSAALAPARTITVSADGKATIVPDLATLSFSVVSQGADPVKLQNDNNAKVNSAIDFVKSQAWRQRILRPPTTICPRTIAGIRKPARAPLMAILLINR